MQKICEVCKKEYQTDRPWRARFCGNSCRSRYHRHGISDLTPQDMRDLEQAKIHLLQALRHLDRVALPRGDVLPLGPMRADLFGLWRRLARRIAIEMKHGAYDPVEVRHAATQEPATGQPRHATGQGDVSQTHAGVPG